MDIKEKIAVIELKIDNLIDEIIEDKPYRRPKAEEILTSLLLARNYLKEKESENEG